MSELSYINCDQLEELLKSKGFKPDVCQVLKGNYSYSYITASVAVK